MYNVSYPTAGSCGETVYIATIFMCRKYGTCGKANVKLIHERKSNKTASGSRLFCDKGAILRIKYYYMHYYFGDSRNADLGLHYTPHIVIPFTEKHAPGFRGCFV